MVDRAFALLTAFDGGHRFLTLGELLLHGEADRFIPCVQSVRLHTALVQAGVAAELYLYEDADHMWLGSPEAASDALARTAAFLREQLMERDPT